MLSVSSSCCPLFVFGFAVADPDGDVEGVVLSKDIMLSSAGPLGAVTVVGDSVLLGAGLWSPTLPDQLQANGWGPIRFRAGVGDKAGPTGSTSTAGWWIESWRREGWDAPNVIVNLGANDSALCRTDVACSRRRILDVVDVIGPGHRIWWPMITRNPGSEADAAAWNAALAQIAAERDDFFTWDWPLEMASGGYVSTDNTHLDVGGYRQRSLRMAAAFTADLARRSGWAAMPPSLHRRRRRASSCHSTRSESSTHAASRRAGDLMAPSSRSTSAVGSRPERRRWRSM